MVEKLNITNNLNHLINLLTVLHAFSKKEKMFCRDLKGKSVSVNDKFVAKVLFVIDMIDQEVNKLTF